MRHITTLYSVAAAFLFAFISVACGEDEEVLTPNETFVDKFDISASASGPEADLKREFYARNGSYLIFNDTLSAVRDASGNLKVETVDFEWSLTSSGDDTDEWEFFETIEEQRAAAEIVEKHILPYIKDGAMRPYSVLPFKSIVTSSGEIVYYKDNWRCFGVNLAEIMPAADDAERKALVLDMFKRIYKGKYRSSSEEADPFHEVCAEYSGEYICDYFPEWEDERDMEIIYSVGYISYKTNKKPYNEKFLTKSNDYTDFVNLVFDNTTEEVYAKYGRYEKIIQKYEIIKALVEKVGIKI